MGRAARSIQCYQVHSSNTLVTSSSEKTYKCKHIFWTMAWRIVCELLLLSKFVSLSVIPENRKLNAELSSVAEERESQRTKRSYSYYSGDDDDDDEDFKIAEHWDSLCEFKLHTRELAKEKHNGKLIFKLNPHLSESGNLDYNQYVTEKECVNPDVIFSRGSERFKCVQQTVRHEVEVFDETREVLIPKKFFINSGCEAKILR